MRKTERQPQGAKASWVFFSAAIMIAASALICYTALDPWGPLEDFLEPQAQESDCLTASEMAMKIDSWTDLSREEQIELMQAVSDGSAAKLLLPFRPIVTTRPMAPSTFAQCLGRCIILNENFPQEPDSGWICARAILHESRHCYQHAVVDGLYENGEQHRCCPDEQTIENWEWEFSHYQSIPNKYWSQQVELDARAYSADAVNAIQAEAKKEGYVCANQAISNKVLI